MIDELLKQAEEFKKELKKQSEKEGQEYLNYLKELKDHHKKTRSLLKRIIKDLNNKDDKIKLAYLINDIDDKIKKIEKRYNNYNKIKNKNKLRIDL